jgi:hypothetical protein
MQNEKNGINLGHFFEGFFTAKIFNKIDEGVSTGRKLNKCGLKYQ